MLMVHVSHNGPGRTLGAHPIICETWYSLLWVTSLSPGGFSSADSNHLSSTQVSNMGSLGMGHVYIVCMLCSCVVCVCVCVCVCAHKHVCTSMQCLCVQVCSACVCVNVCVVYPDMPVSVTRPCLVNTEMALHI